MKDINNKDFGSLLETLLGIPKEYTKIPSDGDFKDSQNEFDVQNEEFELQDFDKETVLASEKEVLQVVEMVDNGDEREEFTENEHILNNFELKKAVIYAEIINPKYF